MFIRVHLWLKEMLQSERERQLTSKLTQVVQREVNDSLAARAAAAPQPTWHGEMVEGVNWFYLDISLIDGDDLLDQ